MRNINGDLDSAICTVFLMPPRDNRGSQFEHGERTCGAKGWQTVVRKYVPEPVYRQFLKN